MKTHVMVAGIGGASLGTEILKSLIAAGGYEVFGCDISPTAYGHFCGGFSGTFLLGTDRYVDEVIARSLEVRAAWIIPGGEEPLRILNGARENLASNGLKLLANSSEVISLCSDKARCFESLDAAGVTIPRTRTVRSAADVEAVGLPCVVKPSTGTGGSVSVFFSTSVEEAMLYATYINQGGGCAIAQEYVSDDEGEFTIGVTSRGDGSVVGSIALRRDLRAKLSVSYRGRGGVISSGYSQGYIGFFGEICRQAETIAMSVGSIGPLNVQGRVRSGVLLPFEINPRLSASVYLRTMADYNEPDLLIREAESGVPACRPKIRPGYYFRSLSEVYSPEPFTGNDS